MTELQISQPHMVSDDLDIRLRRVVERAARDRDLAGIVVRVEHRDGLAWTGSVGELEPDTPFFIASTTKLYTSAIILRLAAQGVVALDDRLVDRCEPGLADGLLVHRGADLTDRITLRHLLSHTSGLPDYFLGAQPGGVSLERQIRHGDDQAWSLDDVLAASRRIGAAFAPGAKGKARYSDTNFQLLGHIIERVTGHAYADALRREILQPLGLGRTWLFTDPADARPLPLRDGPRRLLIPRAMTSFGPDGGIVATADDLMRFLRAFWEGRIFDGALLSTLKVYNRIFFPLEYGIGFSRFGLPRIMSPFSAPPELLGHSGLSGAFAFAAPSEGAYLAGTVNNISRPSRSFRLMLSLMRELRQR